MILEAKDLRGDLNLDTEVLVIGSGAGGGPFAYKMAEAGRDVVILESGGYYTAEDFTEREAEMTAKLYVEGGNHGPDDGSITLYQGRCVGGSTVINAMICFRPPDWVLDDWRTRFGVTGMTPRELESSIDEVERIVSVHTNEPHEINRGNALLLQGAQKLGWHNAPLQRNVKDCVLSGFCLLGCAYDRKRSVLVTYVPLACEMGARLFSDATVDRIIVSGGKVRGASATVRDRETGRPKAKIQVRAKVVAVAAGAVQTPALLQRSGLSNQSGMLGRNFAIHPSAAVSGIFDEELSSYRGALCGTYSAEFHDHGKGGFLIEGGNGGPIQTAFFFPGFGKLHRELMDRFDHTATSVSVVHDPGVGSVNWDADTGKVKIDYAMEPDTQARVKQSVRRMAEMWFAAGARRVVTPFTRPLVLDSPDELGRIDAMPAGPNDIGLTSYHPQATARMGADRKQSVVKPNGESHEVRGLFVVDASVFPTAVDVNPQITIMSVSTHFARGVLADSRRYFGAKLPG